LDREGRAVEPPGQTGALESAQAVVGDRPLTGVERIEGPERIGLHDRSLPPRARSGVRRGSAMNGHGGRVRVEEAQRPVRGLTDAHPRADADPFRRAALAEVEGAARVEQVAAAERRVDVQGAAEAAGAGPRARSE